MDIVEQRFSQIQNSTVAEISHYNRCPQGQTDPCIAITTKPAKQLCLNEDCSSSCQKLFWVSHINIVAGRADRRFDIWCLMAHLLPCCNLFTACNAWSGGVSWNTYKPTYRHLHPSHPYILPRTAVPEFHCTVLQPE